MTRGWLWCAVLAGACAAAGAQAPDLGAMDAVERIVPAGPVAMVDGAAVGREEFLYLYKGQSALAARQLGAEAMTDRLRAEIALGALRELIRREILHQEAVRSGVAVSGAQVEDAIGKRVAAVQEQRAEQGMDALGDELLDRLQGDELHEKMRRVLMIRKVRERFSAEAAKLVGAQDVQKFYETEKDRLFQRTAGVHLRHIFVRASNAGGPPTQPEWEAAQKKIDRAQQRIRAGESFEAVARDTSDADDAASGGDLGPAPEAALPKIYADAAKTLAPGAISGLLKSETGYHLVRLESREDGKPVTLEEARPRIEDALRAAKTEELVDRFCQPIVEQNGRVQVFLALEPLLREAPARDGAASAAPATSGAPARAKAAPAPAPEEGGKKKKKKAS